ncbi:MAG: hypothetical protein ACRCW9_06245 [Cetobacterium sp.]
MNKEKILLKIKLEDPDYFEIIKDLEEITSKAKEISTSINRIKEKEHIFRNYRDEAFPITLDSLKKMFPSLEWSLKNLINNEYISGKCDICGFKRKLYLYEEKGICLECLRKLTKI